MLPLPLFTSGAEVGLFFGEWEVLMCCPQTPSLSLFGELLARAQPMDWGSSDPAPPFLLELYCDAFDLAVNQPLSLPRYVRGWGCSVSPLSPAGPQAAAA